MQVKNVFKAYKLKKGGFVEALSGVTFSLPQSGMIFILGKSGSGKTTLLNMLGGLDTPSDGEVIYGDKALKAYTPAEANAYRGGVCSFIFQDYNLIDGFTVGENLRMAMELNGRKADEETIAASLLAVELKGYEYRSVSSLSGGQKQRAAVAMALCRQSKIILADEPTGALDGKTGRAILQTLKNQAKDKLVVVVTHDREFAAEYGDRIIVLKDGKIERDSDLGAEPGNAPHPVPRKSALKTKTALKTGLISLKAHPVRAAVAMLLCAVSLGLMGLAGAMAFYNQERAYAETFLKRGVRLSAIYKYRRINHENNQVSLEEILGYNDTDNEEIPVSAADAANLGGRLKVAVTPVLQALVAEFQKKIPLKEGENLSRLQAAVNDPSINHNIKISLNGFINLSAAECDRLGYEVTGRLPNCSEEVALPECLFYGIKYGGGLINDDGLHIADNFEDLLGLRIPVNYNTSAVSWATITGVVDTHCDRECGNGHHDESDRFASYNYHEKFFVSADFIDSFTYFLYDGPDNVRAVMNDLKLLKDSFSAGEGFMVYNRASQEISGTTEVMTVLKNLLLYLSIFFAVFALLQLFNFVNRSVTDKMGVMGILKAGGAGKKELMKIFFATALFIAFIGSILAFAGTVIGAVVLNAYIRKEFSLVYNVVSPLYLPFAGLIIVIFAVAVSLLGALIPILKAAKAQPVKTIRRTF